MLLNLEKDIALKIEDINIITVYIDDKYISPKCVALDINGIRFMEKKLNIENYEKPGISDRLNTAANEVLNQFKILLRDIIDISKKTESYNNNDILSIEWLDDDHKNDHHNRYYIKDEHTYNS